MSENKKNLEKALGDHRVATMRPYCSNKKLPSPASLPNPATPNIKPKKSLEELAKPDAHFEAAKRLKALAKRPFSEKLPQKVEPTKPVLPKLPKQK